MYALFAIVLLGACACAYPSAAYGDYLPVPRAICKVHPDMLLVAVNEYGERAYLHDDNILVKSRTRELDTIITGRYGFSEYSGVRFYGDYLYAQLPGWRRCEMRWYHDAPSHLCLDWHMRGATTILRTNIWTCEEDYIERDYFTLDPRTEWMPTADTVLYTRNGTVEYYNIAMASIAHTVQPANTCGWKLFSLMEDEVFAVDAQYNMVIADESGLVFVDADCDMMLVPADAVRAVVLGRDGNLYYQDANTLYMLQRAADTDATCE